MYLISLISGMSNILLAVLIFSGRKGEEIMTMTCDLKDKASLSDFSRYFPSENAEEKDLQGNPCLTMISYLFKSFPSTTMAGFDYLPRLVRQVSLFRPRQVYVGESVRDYVPIDQRTETVPLTPGKRKRR